MLRLPTLLGRRTVSLFTQQRASFHVAAPLLEDTEKKDIASTGPVIDKENPMYAPDSFAPWRNAGYSNVAPAGWTRWEDLEAPYDRYQVRVDKADVENPGMVWKMMTNWKTGLPIAALLALPAFVYDVVLIDERFELMLIFWSAIAMFNHQFGAAVKGTITEQIDEIREELTSAEGKYNAAIDAALETYEKAQAVPEYLAMVNAGERALRSVEADARTRAIALDQRNKIVEMLDYLVMAKNSRDAAIAEQVTTRAREATEAALSDPKMAQKTLANAISALETAKVAESEVEELYASKYAEAKAAVDAELAKASKASASDRDLFAKRFGFVDVVTEEMAEKAASDAAERAVLLAKTGGVEPAAGVKLTHKMPIDY